MPDAVQPFAIVPAKAAWFCMPWRLRFCEAVDTHGGRCCYCDREIAVPDDRRGLNVGCIYCGLETGELPLTEAEAYGSDVPLHSAQGDG